MIGKLAGKLKSKIIKPRVIKKRLEKSCAICGKKIRVILYIDKTYRGGHFFGEIGISTKAEWARVRRLGTTPWKFGEHTFQVLKEDPKPYKHVEYWECSRCYR